jgi:hypothetical protein
VIRVHVHGDEDVFGEILELAGGDFAGALAARDLWLAPRSY